MKEVHKEVREVGTSLVFIECRMIAQPSAFTRYSPDWPDVTCLRCLAKKPKTVK